MLVRACAVTCVEKKSYIDQDKKNNEDISWKFGEGFTLKGDDKPGPVEWGDKEAVLESQG